MEKRKSEENYKNKRMLSWDEAREYCGLGRTSVRNYCDKIGATWHYGKRVLFDREKIDKDINAKLKLK